MLLNEVIVVALRIKDDAEIVVFHGLIIKEHRYCELLVILDELDVLFGCDIGDMLVKQDFQRHGGIPRFGLLGLL